MHITTIKKILSSLILTLAITSCNLQSAKKIQLEKIVFHLSRCNGDCPQIDLVIDSSKKIFVARKYFKNKDEVQTRYSGQYMGVVSNEEYNKLLILLDKCNVDSLQFPESDEVDRVETTIIIYFNGKRKYLKSPEPPTIAKELIAFLRKLAENKKLVKTNKIDTIEN